MESDIDWEDILPSLASDTEDGDKDIIVPVAAEADAAHDRMLAAIGLVSASQPAPVQARANPSRWSIALPAPGSQNKVEQCLAASRMRDAKASMHTAKTSTLCKKAVDVGLATLRAMGLLRDNGRVRVSLKTSSKKNGSVELVIPDTKPVALSYPTVLSLTYSPFHRVSSLSLLSVSAPRLQADAGCWLQHVHWNLTRIFYSNFVNRSSKTHRCFILVHWLQMQLLKT